MKVWIDLANSPHPLLFAPLADRLERDGATVVVTLRDTAQTLPLARPRWPDAPLIGGPTPPSRLSKAWAMASRAQELASWARAARPDVALSHNSYGQLVAARLVGVPSVTAMDYEFQPANHVAFRAATRIMLPEAIPAHTVRRQGATARKVARYAGVKEELYVGDFTPDPDVLGRLGIERDRTTRVVVVRTPPLRATYHGSQNRLFFNCLRALGEMSEVRCVVLARHPEDRDEVESLRLDNCHVPAAVVDARSLMRAADLVIGAGGTMTREAAVMGIPTYSVFAGTRPSVDLWLERRGALAFLQSPRQLREIPARPEPPVELEELRARGRRLQEAFVRSVEDVAAGDRGAST